MSIAAGLIAAAVGLVAGGWLDTIVRRTPMRQRVLGGVATHCPNCGVAMPGVPLVVRVRRATRCGNCGVRALGRWPVYEIVCATWFALIAARFGWSTALVGYLLFAHASIALTVIDVRHHLLPNRIIYPTLFSSIAVLVIASMVDGDFDRLVTALIGMGVSWLFFFVVWFAYPKGMGFGDVRLSLLVGLFTGWIDLGNVVVALFVGLLLGAVSGLVFVALRRTAMSDPIPYGPFLIAGAWISIFFAEPLATVTTKL